MRGNARVAGLPVICGLGVAALLGATLLPCAAPAGADPVSNLQAQAAQLSRQMLLEQLQIDGFQQQRASDVAAVTSDEAHLTAMQQQISSTRDKVTRDRSELADAAVATYVDGGTQVEGTPPIFSSDPSQSASAVYAQVMTGDLTTAMSRLQSDRKRLVAEEAGEQQIVTAAQKLETQANAALADAQATEQTLASQHASVSGQLAVALAQQQAQQAAAARAAAAAAGPYSGSAAASLASSGGSPPLPTLPPFLRCVIQAESGGDYQAVSPTGQYMGAFQFSQPTWNYAAQLAGKPQLVGVPPYDASPYDQDLLAIALYNADGEQPWYDPCRY
jgi:hypothetical protein